MRRRDEAGLTTERLAAYQDDEVTPAARIEIERALLDDADARTRLGQLERIRAALSAPAAELEAWDLVAAVRAAAAKAPPSPRRPRWSVWAAGAAIAAAACIGVFVTHRAPATEQEFRAKSAEASVSATERWAGIQVYQSADERGVTQLGPRMGPRDGLLFSYTNKGSRPFKHLMVFGVGASGRVHWFYPAYERYGEDPTSVSIDEGVTVPMGDVIRHDYTAGPLAVYGLFTQHPLRVSQVEAWLAERNGRLDEVPIEESRVQALHTQVAP